MWFHTCDSPLWFATFGGYLTSLEGVELGNKFLKYKNMMKEGIIIYDNGVNRGNATIA